MIRRIHIVAWFAACTAFTVFAESDFIERQRLSFWHGGEFPGATGSVSRTDGVLELRYDFSNGGHYVAANLHLSDPVYDAESLEMEVSFDENTRITLRLTDSSGQTFQRGFFHDAPEDWERLTCAISPQTWGGHWGGANDGVMHRPFRQLSILAENLTQDRPGGASRTLRVRNIRFNKTPCVTEILPCRFDPVGYTNLFHTAQRSCAELRVLVPQLETRGIGAKSRATLNVMETFFPWIQEDVARGFTNRAAREIQELASIGTNGIARAKRILAGTEKDFPVPRYRTSPIKISHAQTIADRMWPDGRTDRGPVFLTGFGHFGKVRQDLAKLPPLGCNILQMEIGPNSFLPNESTVVTNAIRSFTEAAARAQKENVGITLLLSPHYFPNWALQKWPHLADCADRHGFLKYCVYDPNAKGVIERFLRAIIPLVRGNPALHSICLSNEPETHTYGACRVLRERWPKWLAVRHRTIEAFNAKAKGKYSSFEEVPMPASYSGNETSFELMEFVRFNREQFAAWHRWMADVIHEIAPEIPVHSKIMITTYLSGANATFYSVDPEAFSALSQYSGNDAYDFYLPTGFLWSHDWWRTEAGYDFQRAAFDIPIFNTENHIQPDRSKGYLPGSHTYTVLWQNALHGQAATTLWCWERAYDDGKSDFNGLMPERPEAMESWAHCALDLARLAEDFAPLQNLPPAILIWLSTDAVLSEGTASFGRCYRAATFLGQPLGVVSDVMLERFGKGGNAPRPFDSARVILVPGATAISTEVRAGLTRFRSEGGVVLSVDASRERALFEKLATEAAAWKLPDYPRVRLPQSDKPVFGVETRGYRKDGAAYLSLCNHTRTPMPIRLERAGVNLVTGENVPVAFKLPPLAPTLIRLP